MDLSHASSVRTDALEIAYEEQGPAHGPAVILLHGWPDDARTWDGVAGPLAESGYRVLVPYLRGCGPTRFIDPARPRSGSRHALVADLFAFMDALGIQQAAVVGHDWGARVAYLASGLEPTRVLACGALSVGWGTDSPEQPMSIEQCHNYWYHWLMTLPRGEELVRHHRRELTEYIWALWSPETTCDQLGFDRTSRSFGNPDWADVTLHSYRARWGLAPEDPAYSQIQARAAQINLIGVPTLVIHGAADPCNSPATSSGRESFFSGTYTRVVLDGVGHFPQRTAAHETAELLVRFLQEHVAPGPEGACGSR